MKTNTLILLALSTFLVTSCNKQKAAIDDRAEASKEAIDSRKDSVEAEAETAKEQTDTNAAIDKANIDAAKQPTKLNSTPTKKSSMHKPLLKKPASMHS